MQGRRHAKGGQARHLSVDPERRALPPAVLVRWADPPVSRLIDCATLTRSRARLTSAAPTLQNSGSVSGVLASRGVREWLSWAKSRSGCSSCSCRWFAIGLQCFPEARPKRTSGRRRRHAASFQEGPGPFG